MPAAPSRPPRANDRIGPRRWNGFCLGDGFSSSFAPRLGVDGLSGLFLGILGLIAVPALAFSVRYLRPGPNGRAVGALTALFVLALALVLCGRDPLTFLVGWESMTLIPAVVSAATAAGVTIHDVRISEPSLENLFLHHTGRSLRE